MYGTSLLVFGDVYIWTSLVHIGTLGSQTAL